MNIKSFDINMGFNGEPSTATLSYTNNVKCGSSAGLSSVIKSNLNDFSLSSSKKAIDAGYETITEEYVDKYAKRLEAIAVLVRGVTAPPRGNSYTQFGMEYNNAESHVFPTPSERADTDIFINGNIAVIGRAFSVISAQYEEKTAYRFYAGGLEVGQSPSGDLSPELELKFKENETGASIKYGYYLSDLANLIRSYGYSVAGFPSDGNFILLEFGGSLKDCINGVASMYGYYWTCRGSVIRFYSSSEVSSLVAPSFDGAENSLSSSYSKEYIGKNKIGIILGESEKDKGSSEGQFGFGDRAVTVPFGLASVEKILNSAGSASYLALIELFISFFSFSDKEEVFDLMFLKKYMNDQSFREDSIVKKLYEADNKIKNRTSITLESITDLGLREALEKLAPNDKFLISLLKEDKKLAKLPSKTSIYALLKGATNAFSTLYISRAVSKRVARDYSVVSAGGLTVSGPYDALDKISTIPETVELSSALQALAEAYGKPYNAPSIKTLSEKISFVSKGTTILKDNGKYFVAKRDIFSSDSSFTESANSIKEITRSPLPSVPCETHDENAYVALSTERGALIDSAFKASSEFFKTLDREGRKQYNLRALKIKKDSSGEDDSSEIDDTLYSGRYRSYNAKINQAPSDLATVEIVSFSANCIEADFLNSKFSSLSKSAALGTSSSVTYLGFVPPDENILMSSYSVGFSADGPTTSMSYSSMEFLGIDQTVLMAGFNFSQSKNFGKNLIARQKNFLGVH